MIPPSRVLHDFVCFRGQDIMDLHVHDVETDQVCPACTCIQQKQEHFELPGRSWGSYSSSNVNVALVFCGRVTWGGSRQLIDTAAPQLEFEVGIGFESSTRPVSCLFLSAAL